MQEWNNQIHNIVSNVYNFLKGQPKNQSTFMEDQQNTLELYQQYSLTHFQIYKKITSIHHYKAVPYNQLPISLKNLVEIFVEFLLLLLKMTVKPSSLAIAAHPGIFFGQKVHFYILDALSVKGFIPYKQNQRHTEIKKFIQTLSCANLIQRQYEDIQEERLIITKCFSHYVEQAFRTNMNPRVVLQDGSVIILDILTSLSNQKAIVKYSRIFQIKNSILSNRIVEQSVYPRNEIEPQQHDNQSQPSNSSVHQWQGKVTSIHQFLKDCEERKVIENLQQKKYYIAFQDNESTQNENQIEIIKLRFEIDTHHYKASYQNQKNQAIQQLPKETCPFKMFKIELVFQSDETHFVDIKTQFYAHAISKKDFYFLDALWTKVQALWMQVTISSGAKMEIMNIQGIKIHHSEENQLQIREKIKFYSIQGLKQQFVSSVDKQIIQQFIIMPYLEEAYLKKNQTIRQTRDKSLSFQQKNQEISLLLNKWTTYLQQKLTIFMDSEKQPLLLLK